MKPAMNNVGTELKQLGSTETGMAIAARAERVVPAYRAFLAAHGWRAGAPFAARPLMDKHSYILCHEFATLLADDYLNTFSIFRSSGSSGRSVAWPQLKEAHQHTTAALRAYLEHGFGIDRIKTLAIVGLALGSWIGGEHLSWALKSMAAGLPYPFAVYSPGSHHGEMIEMIMACNQFADQFLLVLCPSAIAHLHLKAADMHITLPWHKLRYLVLGESFPEHMRAALHEQAAVAPGLPVMLSIYGSADTGVLGAESPASAALRALLTRNSAARAALGVSEPVPLFFHAASHGVLLETVHQELCVTKWQGIPLVRYNLHDHAQLLHWPAVRRTVLAAATATDAPLCAVLAAAGDALPDLIAVAGRADASLILCGTNITEAMLDAAVRCPELDQLGTGAYKARISYEGTRQYLAMTVELRSGVCNDDRVRDHIYHAVVRALGRVQPEFLDDWRNIYSAWDTDPVKRAVRITCVPWPALSQAAEQTIKQRGVSA